MGDNRRGDDVRASLCCTSCWGANMGKPPEDEQGIPLPRNCTDVAFLVTFVVFLCVMLLVSVFGLIYGDPLRLVNGMDSFGNVCGTTNDHFGNLSFSGLDMTDRPFVFFMDLDNMERSTKVCISQCPSHIADMQAIQSYFLSSGVNLCRYDFNVSQWKEGAEGTDTEFTKVFCPVTPYPASHGVLNRCIPTESSNANFRSSSSFLQKIYDYLNNLDVFKQLLGDLSLVWPIVIGLTGAAFVMSFSLIILVHWMTAIVSYLILITACLICVGLTGFLWWTFADIKSYLDTQNADTILEEMKKNERAFLFYSIFATVGTICLILISLVLRKRINIIVKLFRETGSVLCSMPCIVLQPFVTYITLIVFYCAWLYIFLCLATADYMTPRKFGIKDYVTTLSYNDSIIPESQLMVTPAALVAEQDSGGETVETSFTVGSNITSSELERFTGITMLEQTGDSWVWVKYLWLLQIFALIWISEFILGCQQMIIASSVASWYFTKPGERSQLKFILLRSIWRLIKYHIGSVALGSLIITILKIPRLILMFSERIFRRWDESKCIQWLAHACYCCLHCFENCLKYVHHNAYTVIAIQGVDFCPASRLAFAALVHNTLEIGVINSIGDFVLFLVKCLTAAITGLIAVFVFRSDGVLHFYAMPVLITVVFSYFVAHCVISVFEMAVDTLFLCFCEDHNMNDGSKGKEFFSPPSLLRYMTIDAVDALNKSNLRRPNEASVCPEEIIPMNPTATTSSSA